MAFYYNDTEVTDLYYNDTEVTDMYYNDALVYTNQRYKWWKYNVVTQNNYSPYFVKSSGNWNYYNDSTRAMSSAPSITNDGLFNMASGSSVIVSESTTPVNTYCAANSDNIRTGSGVDYPSFYGVITSISDNTLPWIGRVSSTANADLYGIQNNPRYGMGSYVGEVRSRTADDFPSFGIKDGYWYVSQDLFLADNTGLPHGSGTTTHSGFSATGYMPLPSGCTQVTVYGGGGSSSSYSIMNEFDSNYNYVDWWGHGSDPRTINLTGGTNTKYIRCEFNTSNLANCYAKDETHNVYIFRGTNV